jgi:hypothetical protein
MCGWLNHVRPGSLVQLHGDRIMIVAACGDRDEQRPWVPSDLWAHAIDCITLQLSTSPQVYVASMASVIA